MPPDQSPYWEAWRGLPHEIGADPREGRAACCLVIAKIVLERAGRVVPPIEGMLEAARRGDWIRLETEFRMHCKPIAKVEVPSVTLINNRSHGLGVLTVVAPNTLLSLNHKRGVITLPINQLRFVQFYTTER